MEEASASFRVRTSRFDWAALAGAGWFWGGIVDVLSDASSIIERNFFAADCDAGDADTCSADVPLVADGV